MGVVVVGSRIGSGLECSLPALQTLVLTNNSIEEFVSEHFITCILMLIVRFFHAE